MSIDRSTLPTSIKTLDLGFMGIHHAIASYLIPHTNGAVLIETGPGSTIPALQTNLANYGLSEKDVTDVFLTHIHLDHAGAAGWFARQGASIHVHPNGAPHLLDPEKLLASAARIYGDEMEKLWGEFLPVPPERLKVLQDGEVVEIGGLSFQALDTPGHANHHFVYLFQEVCLSGDIGGVRMPESRHLRLPMPPPEFHLELWHESLSRLLREYSRGTFKHIAPTHFGIFDDPGWHLAALKKSLDEVGDWIENIMPTDPSIDQMTKELSEWTNEKAMHQGLDLSTIQAYEVANPTWMSVPGIQRYWRKFRRES